jgi:hypothetical protein
MNDQEKPTSKQEELTDDLERFKSMFQFPKLFLSTYFSELRNKIDVAFLSKNNLETDFQIKDDLNEIWIEMIEHVNDFERECCAIQRTNKFNIQLTKEINADLKRLDDQLLSTSFNDSTTTTTLYDSIRESIVELDVKIKKILFQNKTIAFINENKYSDLKTVKKKFNTKTTAGILLFIQDEFINENSITKIISYDKLLTNEKIKLIELKKKLINSNYIQQIELKLNDLIDLDFHKVIIKVLIIFVASAGWS